MNLIDNFLIWWLKKGRYPWSRLVRKLARRKHKEQALPAAKSPEEIAVLLDEVKWTMDGPLHLYDSVNLPEVVWSTKRDDCDGFAILAAALLKSWDPATNPKLLTVILRPVKNSHTICVFRENGNLSYFDNQFLKRGNYQSYEDVAAQIQKRGGRLICWDVVEPENLQTLEFHEK